MTKIYNLTDETQQTPLSDILAAAADIEGIDIRLALGRISGRQAVLEDSIKQVVYLIDEKLRKMAASLSSEDLREFSIEAHGLKSALAGIGATSYSELASELEKASKAGELSLCKEQFIVFAGSMKQLASKLKSVFPAQSAAKKPLGGSELLVSAAGKAAGYLSDFEAEDALNCMRELCEFTFGEETDALIGQIINKIVCFKYSEAILLLKSIS